MLRFITFCLLLIIATSGVAFSQEVQPAPEAPAPETEPEAAEEPVPEAKADLSETPDPSIWSNLQMELGLAIGAAHLPEEEELSSNGTPMALQFDLTLSPYLGLNLSVAQLASTVEYTAFSKDWVHEYELTEVQLAYLYTNEELVDNLKLRALAGISSVSVKMTANNDYADQSGSALGLMFGLGGRYYFGDFGLGASLNHSTATTELDGVTTAVGNNLLNLEASYQF